MLHVAMFSLSFSSVGCGHPSSPVKGSINHFNSTQEGANISVQCYWEGEVRVSHCDQNGKWVPDPVLMNCSKPVIGMGVGILLLYMN